jgi:hypothetical protein
MTRQTDLTPICSSSTVVTSNRTPLPTYLTVPVSPIQSDSSQQYRSDLNEAILTQLASDSAVAGLNVDPDETIEHDNLGDALYTVTNRNRHK